VSKLLAAICALVFILLGASFYFAGKSFDGVVEQDYYRSATRFFTAREEEKRLGFTLSLPSVLPLGRSDFRAGLSVGGAPLKGARVSLVVRGVAAPRAAASYVLDEGEPGIYRSEVLIPSPGRWLLSLDISSPALSTSRTWMTTVK
jgi:hypothetical protein